MSVCNAQVALSFLLLWARLYRQKWLLAQKLTWKQKNLIYNILQQQILVCRRARCVMLVELDMCGVGVGVFEGSIDYITTSN